MADLTHRPTVLTITGRAISTLWREEARSEQLSVWGVHGKDRGSDSSLHLHYM